MPYSYFLHTIIITHVGVQACMCVSVASFLSFRVCSLSLLERCDSAWRTQNKSYLNLLFTTPIILILSLVLIELSLYVNIIRMYSNMKGVYEILVSWTGCSLLPACSQTPSSRDPCADRQSEETQGLCASGHTANGSFQNALSMVARLGIESSDSTVGCTETLIVESKCSVNMSYLAIGVFLGSLIHWNKWPF